MTHEQKQNKRIKELEKTLKEVIAVLEANNLCEPGVITLEEETGGGPGP